MSTESFRGLFCNGRSVVIPMIQRDYAQGRGDNRSRSILGGFLDSLFAALSNPEVEALDLDFVYGRYDETGTLEPLDGQQRLTTLFLLHWYLGQLDGCQADFRSWMRNPSGRSRFGYRTRPSAEEFIDALVGQDVEIAALPDEPAALSNWIADRPWFLRAWRRDPTVSGCLSALDAMHERFRDMANGYELLASTKAPRVTFHLLDLGTFKLSDDLYVKMNARGKPLTAFEVLKAEFEQYVECEFPEQGCPHATETRLTWKEYVSDRMDCYWTDFLWHHGDEYNYEIDARFLQLLRAIALIHCALQDDPVDEVLEGQVERLLREPEPNLHFYREIGCLTRRFVERLVALMDTLASCPKGILHFLGRSDYFDENAAFRALFKPTGQYGMRLPDWAKLAAYGMFLLARPGELHTEAARSACHEWMRVACNLVNNSDIDRVGRLAGALQSLAAMHRIGAGDSFLSYVAASDTFGQGLNREQRVEERIKAQLILGAASWRPIIERAEAHAYFLGDLQFLLRFSNIWGRWQDTGSYNWPEEEHETHQRSLTHWYNRACAVFPPGRPGLGELGATNEFLWERALLVHGDYLLRSRRNMSLLDDRDRDASWKRLLRGDTKLDDHADRRAVVQRVLAQIDPDAATASLRSMVDKGPGKDAPMWRRLLAADPRYIAECKRRMLRFEDDAIYLLEKVQRNGYHVDLYIFALYIAAVDRRQRDLLEGFKVPEHPRVHGGADRCKLTLERTDGEAVLEVTTEQTQQVFNLTIAERWSNVLRQAGWTRDAETWVRRVPLERGKDVLFAFVSLFTGQSAADE